MPFIRTHFFVSLSVTLLAAIAGSESKARTPQPWAADVAAASAPGYQPPPGSSQECLGRLVFNTDRPVEWPTFYHPDMTQHWGSTFSRQVYQGDGMQFGRDDTGFGKVQVAVFDSASREVIKQVKQDLPSESHAFYSTQIKTAEKSLRELRARPATPKTTWNISKEEDRIKDYQKSLSELQAKQFKFSAGVADAEGYGEIWGEGGDDEMRYSRYRAYVTRGAHIYMLEATRQLSGNLTKESHAQEFASLLKNFSVRKAGEVPAAPGICIPFGFFPVSAQVNLDLKQSFRMADAPGVLHTIRTGNHELYRGPTPAMRAAALAATGKLGSAEEAELKPFITERVGPKLSRIGGLAAPQGGFAARIMQPGQQPFEAYGVYTGYAGWEGRDDLPFIVVEMNSKSVKAAPELKQNPPPFKTSMARHESLLKSIRVRQIAKPK
jgi:hypothetical protein